MKAADDRKVTCSYNIILMIPVWFEPCDWAGTDWTRWEKGCCCEELSKANYKATGTCLFGLSQFLPKMVEVTTPLTELLKRGQPDKLHWIPGGNNAFRHMKETLVQAPVLRITNSTEMLVLQTDTPYIKSRLRSIVEWIWWRQALAFASWKLLHHEVNYA